MAKVIDQTLEVLVTKGRIKGEALALDSDSIWEQHCLVSVGSVYVFAHDFLVVLKLALSLTVNSEQRKRLFTQSVSGMEPIET